MRAKSEVMQITLEHKPLEQIEAGALIVPVFEGQKEARFGAGSLEPERSPARRWN